MGGRALFAADRSSPLHWDGTAWTVTVNPTGDMGFGIEDAAGLSSGGILAVGENNSGSCCLFPGAALWHDGLWSNLHIDKYHYLYCLPATTAVGNGAAVPGEDCQNPSWCQYRWNGHRFRDVWAQRARDCHLRTVTSRGADVWAAGARIEKWAGHAFHVYAQLPTGDALFGSTVLPVTVAAET